MATQKLGIEAEMEGALIPKDAARLVGVGVLTMKNWRVRNIGPPYIKIGWRVVYPRKRLEQWMKERVVLVIPDSSRAA